MQYLLWLSLFVWLPIAMIWGFNHALLWKYRRTLLYAMFFALVFSVPWDIYAVLTKIWFFPPEGNAGIFLLGLPIEEYLFITTTTLMLASVTIVAKYRLMKKV